MEKERIMFKDWNNAIVEWLDQLWIDFVMHSAFSPLQVEWSCVHRQDGMRALAIKIWSEKKKIHGNELPSLMRRFSFAYR